VAAVLGAAGFGGYRDYVKFSAIRQHHVAIAAAHSWANLNEYADRPGGWYPKGGKDPWNRSQIALGKSRTDFHKPCAGSQLAREWEMRKTFSSNLCCYRYMRA